MRLAKFDQQYLASVPAIIGLDEAGRGPLAGPVCAAAVYLDRGFYESDWFGEYGPEINDSKQLKEARREYIYEAVEKTGGDFIHYSCHMVSVEEIESLNILGATRKAMELCVKELRSKSDCRFRTALAAEDPVSQDRARQAWLFGHSQWDAVAHILVDGKPLQPCTFRHTAIVRGDGKSLAIALASILAKVTRDRYMRDQAKTYPEYGFISNKGYGTPKHIAALKACGPCKLHRMSFISRILNGYQ